VFQVQKRLEGALWKSARQLMLPTNRRVSSSTRPAPKEQKTHSAVPWRASLRMTPRSGRSGPPPAGQFQRIFHQICYGMEGKSHGNCLPRSKEVL
jgi:hypothetical protein